MRRILIAREYAMSRLVWDVSALDEMFFVSNMLYSAKKLWLLSIVYPSVSSLTLQRKQSNTAKCSWIDFPIQCCQTMSWALKFLFLIIGEIGVFVGIPMTWISLGMEQTLHLYFAFAIWTQLIVERRHFVFFRLRDSMPSIVSWHCYLPGKSSDDVLFCDSTIGSHYIRVYRWWSSSMLWTKCHDNFNFH